MKLFVINTKFIFYFLSHIIISKISVALALGCYLSLNNSKYTFTPFIFRTEKGKAGSGSKSYCKSLKALVSTKFSELKKYVRTANFNSHGLRKGGATHSTSRTTCPPPLTSVAARGEWSLGKIMDIYFKFGDPGDQYLGRIMAGLDPNSELFGILPPHFKESEKWIEDPELKEAMNLCFGPFIRNLNHQCTIFAIIIITIS